MMTASTPAPTPSDISYETNLEYDSSVTGSVPPSPAPVPDIAPTPHFYQNPDSAPPEPTSKLPHTSDDMTSANNLANYLSAIHLVKSRQATPNPGPPLPIIDSGQQSTYHQMNANSFDETDAMDTGDELSDDESVISDVTETQPELLESSNERQALGIIPVSWETQDDNDSETDSENVSTIYTGSIGANDRPANSDEPSPGAKDSPSKAMGHSVGLAKVWNDCVKAEKVQLSSTPTSSMEAMSESNMAVLSRNANESTAEHSDEGIDDAYIIEITREEFYGLDTRNTDNTVMLLSQPQYESTVETSKLRRLTSFTAEADLNKSLQYAARIGDEYFARAFLQKGATIDTRSRRGMTALHLAAYMGHAKVVQVLLEHDAGVDAVVDGSVEFRNFGRNITLKSPTALHMAANKYHLEVVRVLLERNAEPDKRCEIESDRRRREFSLIHWAIDNKLEDLVKILVQSRIRLNAWSEYDDGMTPLSLAARNGYEWLVRFLCEHNADVNAINRYGQTPMHIAVENNSEEIVHILFKHNADVNAAGWDGKTPLCIAVENNSEEIVRILCKHNANANAVQWDGRSLLRIAVENKSEEIVRLLFEHNVAFNASGWDGGDLLRIAVKNNSEGIVRLLCEHSADVNAVGRAGRIPLRIAVENNSEEIVRLLCEHNADVNAVEWDGRNLLRIAVENNSEGIVRILCEHNADVNKTDEYGWNLPLCIAVENSSEEIVRLLCEHNADVNKTVKYGWTPLYIAVTKGHEKVTRILYNYGANVNAITAAGETPLRIAARHKNKRLVHILRKHNAEVNVADNNG